MTDPAGNSTSFTGTAATKDTSAPTNPVSAAIASGANNDANVVNSFNEGATTLDLNWDPSMLGDEDVTFTITSDGGGMQTFGPVNPPVGGGVGTVGPIDLSGLTDGNLTISYELVDPADNSSTGNGTPGSKDSTLSDPATSANVVANLPAPPGNNADSINASNVGSTSVDVVLGATSVAADEVRIRLVTGATTVNAGPINAPTGAGTITFSGIDTSTLADGPVMIFVDVTDPSRNLTTSSGTQATKDVALPAAINSAGVIANTPDNNANFINENSEATATVAVDLPVSYDGNESVSITLTGPMSATVNAGPLSAPAGGGILNFTGLDTSALAEGNVTIQVDVVDGNQNPDSFAGTTAVKDVTDPVAPMAASLFVQAGVDNAVNVINMHSVAATVLAVTWDVSMAGDETASVLLTSDGGGTATSGNETPAGLGWCGYLRRLLDGIDERRQCHSSPDADGPRGQHVDGHGHACDQGHRASDDSGFRRYRCGAQ